MGYRVKVLFCLVGLIMIPGISAQDLTKEAVFTWGRNYFPDVKMESRTLFIINGVLYDNDQVDSQLRKEEEYGRRISYIGYLPSAVAEKIVQCIPNYGVWIISTYPQKRKRIKSELKKIRKLSPDFPAVNIDGYILESKNIERCLMRLKAKDIYGVQFIRELPQPEKYGPEGTNGMIIIRMKKVTDCPVRY
ncbi:MAG: hypothetical protein LUG98_09805 [Tannerellaceae bacterium]|nr:hypothetical protein [Tannerellaceae bacterium]